MAVGWASPVAPVGSAGHDPPPQGGSVVAGRCRPETGTRIRVHPGLGASRTKTGFQRGAAKGAAGRAALLMAVGVDGARRGVAGRRWVPLGAAPTTTLVRSARSGRPRSALAAREHASLPAGPNRPCRPRPPGRQQGGGAEAVGRAFAGSKWTAQPPRRSRPSAHHFMRQGTRGHRSYDAVLGQRLQAAAGLSGGAVASGYAGHGSSAAAKATPCPGRILPLHRSGDRETHGHITPGASHPFSPPPRQTRQERGVARAPCCMPAGTAGNGNDSLGMQCDGLHCTLGRGSITGKGGPGGPGL